MENQVFEGTHAEGRALVNHFSTLTRHQNRQKWCRGNTGFTNATVSVREVIFSERGIGGHQGVGKGAPGLDGLPIFFYREF